MSRPVSELPDFLREFFGNTAQVLQETAGRVKERLAVPGTPVTYPINWDSEKQKIFVISKLRRENNLPYERTHLHERSFMLQLFEYSARIYADHPAGAVVGIPSGWQSAIHRGRYPHLLTVLFEELSKVPAEISNKFTVKGD